MFNADNLRTLLAVRPFVPFRFDHMPHLQIIWGGWLPLMLAALLHYWKRSTWWAIGPAD